ncbi:hypothetical protein R2APBS1_2426 [Rhodanobacter denitrificans]|uniref:Uncharacterized protein n=1 Tax=Rhodanobacter denitrificans TaxID=666685 RepID=M4NHG2_9GAMM|nr:hypothetical protein R2APBS1_2426 [Rhodanobacter denitrificans]
MAPMAMPAASLCRCALAHPEHHSMHARAHGTMRAPTSRRKPATALTCHPSSGHVGGSNQRSAAGRRAGNRLGTHRERTHCAGAGITTGGATGRRADEAPDFQRTGAIRYTRPGFRGMLRTVMGFAAGCLPSTPAYLRLSPCEVSAVVGVEPSTWESCSRARSRPVCRCRGSPLNQVCGTSSRIRPQHVCARPSARHTRTGAPASRYSRLPPPAKTA